MGKYKNLARWFSDVKDMMGTESYFCGVCSKQQKTTTLRIILMTLQGADQVCDSCQKSGKDFKYYETRLSTYTFIEGN